MGGPFVGCDSLCIASILWLSLLQHTVTSRGGAKLYSVELLTRIASQFANSKSGARREKSQHQQYADMVVRLPKITIQKLPKSDLSAEWRNTSIFYVRLALKEVGP